MQLKIDNSKTKTKTKKKKNGFKALIALIVVFVIYIGLQICNTLASKVSTEVVGYGSATDSIITEGVIIRNETLVTSNNSGVLNYLVRDGEKVAIGSKIASYYSSKEQISAINQLNVLDKQIESYQAMNSNVALGSYDTVSNDVLIGKTVKNLFEYSQKGDFHSAYDLKNDIQMLVNRKRVLLGEVANFDSEIVNLKAQRAQAAAAVGVATNDVYTQTSGYFLKNTDGYEKLISANNISSYDVSALNDLIKATPQTFSNGVIGKVVNDFEFYYCTTLSTKVTDNLRVGQSIELSFPSLEGNQFPAEIAYISKPSGDKNVVGFKCNYMASCLNLQRKQKAEVILKTYTGLKVPQGAVRMIDNQQGVYILAGTQARFKKIETVFFKDGYYIVKQDYGNTASLLLYDTVIVKGANLYNGKIVG